MMMDEHGFLPAHPCRNCGRQLRGADSSYPAELYAGTYTGICYECHNCEPCWERYRTHPLRRWASARDVARAALRRWRRLRDARWVITRTTRGHAGGQQ